MPGGHCRGTAPSLLMISSTVPGFLKISIVQRGGDTTRPADLLWDKFESIPRIDSLVGPGPGAWTAVSAPQITVARWNLLVAYSHETGVPYEVEVRCLALEGR